MPQITFTCSRKDLELIDSIDGIAEKDGRSRSAMIVLLLQQAVKEKNRKKNAKKLHIQNNPTD